MNYSLEKYHGMKTRYLCPSCGKRELARYVDEDGNHLADHVGRCNREANCGYHYTPKQFFADNPDKRESLPIVPQPPQPKPQPKPDYVNPETVETSWSHYEENNFILFLDEWLGRDATNVLIDRFCIGTSKHWQGATVFWQIDAQTRVRTGKVMLYDRETGKRVKQPFSHIQWVHKVLKMEEFNLSQCLFGLHQIRSDKSKPVAIVESEKTAVISSYFLPEFLWLACGGLSNLNAEKIKPISDRDLILFPDVNGFNKWDAKRNELQKVTSKKVLISDFLEEKATTEERKQGVDLADYFLNQSLIEL
jgi:hypothetical protein